MIINAIVAKAIQDHLIGDGGRGSCSLFGLVARIGRSLSLLISYNAGPIPVSKISARYDLDHGDERAELVPLFYTTLQDSMQKDSFQNLITGAKPVLIDFHAEWCGPCKAMAPVISQVAGRWNDRVRFVKIDIDRNTSLAQRLNIRGVPTFILYNDSKLLWRQSGMLSGERLEQILTQYVES